MCLCTSKEFLKDWLANKLLLAKKVYGKSEKIKNQRDKKLEWNIDKSIIPLRERRKNITNSY
ncbi:MAG: hypothetical protein ABIK78_02835 [candidate division WOR-3 bacterium]